MHKLFNIIDAIAYILSTKNHRLIAPAKQNTRETRAHARPAASTVQKTVVVGVGKSHAKIRYGVVFHVS